MNRRLALKVFIIDKETSGKWIIKNKALVPWRALGTLFLIIHLPSVFIYYWTDSLCDNLLPPANEVCEGYVFTGVCLYTGGISVWRIFVQVVSVWGGVSVQVGGSLSKGVLCQGDPRTVTSGWYASYWNAFLLSRPFISCCFFEDASPFLWGPLIPLFWTSGDVSSGFQSHSEHPWTSGDVSSLFQSHNGQSYSHLVEAYVLQIPRDSPLVRHLPTPANIADRL